LTQWHATLTANDEKWLEEALKENLPPTHSIQEMETGSVELAKEDFMLAAMNAGKKQGIDPKAWTIGTYVVMPCHLHVLSLLTKPSQSQAH